MSLKITGKGVELAPSDREYIADKFEKLEKFQVDFHSQDVFVKLVPPKLYRVEVAIKSSVGPLDASAENKLLAEALTEVFERIERQLIKQKDKPLARRDKKDLQLLNEIEEAEAIDEEVQEAQALK